MDYRYITITEVANGLCSDMTRQNEAAKKEQSFLRSNLATAGSGNIEVVEGQGARKPNKYSRRNPKTFKTVNKSQR